VTGAIEANGPKTSDGLRAASAVLTASATLVGAQASTATVEFTLLDREGKPVASSSAHASTGITPSASAADACPPHTFNFSASGLDCDGLQKHAAGDSSADSCRQACCASPDCNVWQWTVGSSSAGAGCWAGHASCSAEPVSSHAKWVGGARTRPHGGGHPCGSRGGAPCSHRPPPHVDSYGPLVTVIYLCAACSCHEINIEAQRPRGRWGPMQPQRHAGGAAGPRCRAVECRPPVPVHAARRRVGGRCGGRSVRPAH
jgi:hypothetical protein